MDALIYALLGLLIWSVAWWCGYDAGRRVTASRIRAIVSRCTSRGKGTNGLVKAKYLYDQLAADR